MDTLNGRPKLLKQANLSLIRKVITAEGTANPGRDRPQNKHQLHHRSLAAGRNAGERRNRSLGFDASSRGRKAQRYGV